MSETRTEQKRCRKCRHHKPRTDFHNNRTTPDGLTHICKPCKRQIDKHAYWAKKGEPPRTRTADDPARRVPAKVKHLARRTLNAAVAEGRITKPDRCEDCDSLTPSRSLHGHHEDYAKPLEVDWLCRRCHERRHTVPITGTPWEGIDESAERGGAKLTEVQVAEIHKRIAAGSSQSQIAREFGVSQSLISRIRSGECWSLAESMRRFDSNFKRMQREMRKAGDEGATHREITAIANEALRSDPDLLRRVNELTARMAEREAGSNG